MKLAENRQRDHGQVRAIMDLGWNPVVIWEHQVRRDPILAVWRALADGTASVVADRLSRTLLPRVARRGD